jgi:hypothetical protein
VLSRLEFFTALFHAAGNDVVSDPITIGLEGDYKLLPTKNSKMVEAASWREEEE